jgi:hypothetical protein
VCQGRVQAFLHKPLAGPKDRVGAGVQCLGDSLVVPSVARLGDVGLQQDARPEQLPCRVLARSNQHIQPIAFVIGNRGKNVGMAAFFACSGSTRCDSLRMCRSLRPFLG